jgi:hypothetical protein
MIWKENEKKAENLRKEREEKRIQEIEEKLRKERQENDEK